MPVTGAQARRSADSPRTFIVGLWVALVEHWPRSPFWRVLVCVPGVVLLLLPLLLAKDAAEFKLLSITLGIIALILPAWIGVYVPQRDKRMAAIRARDALLEPLRLVRPVGTAPTAWMWARWSTSRFYGRHSAMKTLSAWLQSPSPAVMVMEGGPQQGKKRLAVEWGVTLGAEWVRGWLRPDPGQNVIDRIIAAGEDTLLVIDGVTHEVPSILSALSQHSGSPTVKVLLIVRHAAGLRVRDPRAAALIDGFEPLRLQAFGEPSDKKRWFTELAVYYAMELGVEGVEGVEVPSEFSSVLGESSPIGLVHIAALAAVQSESTALRGMGIEDLLKLLWRAETISWDTSRNDPDWGLNALSKSQVEFAVLALLLLAPADIPSGVEILRKVPELSELDAGTLRNMVDWARDTYPPHRQGIVLQLEPHLISDAAFLARADADPAFARTLLGDLNEKEAPRVWSRLVDLAALLPSAARLAALLVGADGARLRTVVEVVLSRGLGEASLDRELASRVYECALDESQVESLQRLVAGTALPYTQAKLAELRVQHARLSATKGAFAQSTNLANALSHLALARAKEGGRSAEALDSVDEAIALFRQLTDESVRAQSELAFALTVQGGILREMRDKADESISATQESVNLFRQLCVADSTTYEPGLAGALTELSYSLSGLGGREMEARAAAEESVELFRREAGSGSIAYQSGLAAALLALTVSLEGSVAADDIALEAAEETVDLYRQLVLVDRPAFEPGLADALMRRSSLKGRADGRAADAVTDVEEALALYKRLAAENPALYEARCAAALSNFVATVGPVRPQSRDLIKAGNEAVALFRRLASRDPGTYDIGLAATLLNLGNALAADDGRRAEGLALTRESVALFRRMWTADAVHYERGLASALDTLASTLRRIGTHEAEAVDAATESVTLHRRLFVADPSDDGAGLASALHSLSHCVEDNGSLAEAKIYAEEAMRMYGRLSAQDSRFESMHIKMQQEVAALVELVE